MHREELKNSDFKQTQLASLQVELGKANSNKASFRQIDLNLHATLTMTHYVFVIFFIGISGPQQQVSCREERKE